MNKEMFGPVDVAGLHLESPIMNGAGPIKLKEQVAELAQSDVAAIVVGSITIEERSGNFGTTYFMNDDSGYSLNSKGLPNPGLAYYQKYLPEIIQIAHDHGKPLIMSVAGFSPAEYAQLIDHVLKSDVDGIELNLGCPNVWSKDGKQKRITSFDTDLVGETLRQVERTAGKNEWISVKLSPFSDPIVLTSIATILERAGFIKAVTSTNTFPNSFALNDLGESVIDPGGGLGGLGGKAMKPIGLGQIKQLRVALPTSIALIGVGGITEPRDVSNYLHAGASAVQVTTAYLTFGSEVFSRLKKR